MNEDRLNLRLFLYIYFIQQCTRRQCRRLNITGIILCSSRKVKRTDISGSKPCVTVSLKRPMSLLRHRLGNENYCNRDYCVCKRTKRPVTSVDQKRDNRFVVFDPTRRENHPVQSTVNSTNYKTPWTLFDRDIVLKEHRTDFRKVSSRNKSEGFYTHPRTLTVVFVTRELQFVLIRPFVSGIVVIPSCDYLPAILAPSKTSREARDH